MDDDTRKLLVLDIDETMLYATKKPLAGRTEDFNVYGYYIYLRPHLQRFLLYILDHFRVAVWTSSGELYADAVIDKIFPSRQQLEFLWSSDRCTVRIDCETGKHYHLKQLKKLKRLGFNLEQVIMVDDTPMKHQKNYGNLIHVSEYDGNLDDNELLCLEQYLALLEPVPNVRTIEKRSWRSQVGCV